MDTPGRKILPRKLNKRKKTNEKRYHPTKKNPHLFRTFTFVCYICGAPCPGASRPPNPTFADVTFLPAPLLIRQTKLFSVLAWTRRGFVAEPSTRQPFGNLHYLAISLSTWTCSDMVTVTTIPRPLPPRGPRAPVSRLDRPPPVATTVIEFPAICTNARVLFGIKRN